MYYSRSEKIKKIIAYARYSSSHQNPVSIEIQLEGIEKYAKEKGYQIEKAFVDRAKSGGGMKNRSGFQDMMEKISTGSVECDAVVVYHYDRAGRNVHDMKVLERLLQKHRKRFISVMEPTDESSVGKLHRNVQHALNEYERNIIGDRSFEGLKNNAKKGVHCGGVPPLGYVLDENKRLAIDDKEAEAVRRIFQMYDRGYGYGRIAGELNENGYLTKQKLIFKKNSIHDILINEKYTGTYVYNKAFPRDIDGGNNSHKYKDEEDIVRIDNTHPAIIDKELFERVQEKLQQRSKKPRESKHNYILRNLIRCKICGAVLYGEVNHDSRDKTKLRSYYRCPNRKVKACHLKPINRDDVEARILEILYQKIFSGLNIEDITGVVNHAVQNDSEIKDKIERFQQVRKEQERQKERLYRQLKLIDRDDLGKRVIKDIEKLMESQKEVQHKIDVLEKKKARVYLMNEVGKAVDKINAYVKSHRNGAAWEYLNCNIQEILVDNDIVEIVLKEEDKEENECA